MADDIGTMGVDVKLGGRRRTDGVETLGGIVDPGRAPPRRGRTSATPRRVVIPEGMMFPDQTFEGNKANGVGRRFAPTSDEVVPERDRDLLTPREEPEDPRDPREGGGGTGGTRP